MEANIVPRPARPGKQVPGAAKPRKGLPWLPFPMMPGPLESHGIHSRSDPAKRVKDPAEPQG